MDPDTPTTPNLDATSIDRSVSLDQTRAPMSEHHTLHHASPFPQPVTPLLEHAHFEDAIQRSVAATSHGDAEEDRMIERAIRASVAELVRARREQVSEQLALDRAVGASVMVANNSSQQVEGRNGGLDQTLLESSLQQSLQSQQPRADNEGDPRSDPDKVAVSDDEDMKRALDASKALAAAKTTSTDKDLQQAIEESKRLQVEHDRETVRSRTEEEVVIEYIKKQSLLEEEHHKALEAKNGKEVAGEKDVELAQAIEQSLSGTDATPVPVERQVSGESSRS